jgi:YesN/AraC family two-component response regulator
MLVKAEMDSLGIKYGAVELGEVHTLDDITPEQHTQLKESLLKSGLELMDDKRAILIEKIKNVIIEMVHYADEQPTTNFSDYVTKKLNHPYKNLAALFSEVTGITIEHYIIIHKIERAKELLLYDELNLTEIANKLNYSSVSHLSAQFKKTTGQTPTQFKKIKKHKDRVTLESLLIM